MYYRLSCITESGESRGYQWRELDSATFIAIATGTRPLGDAEAQTRDSTDIDSTFGNGTIYYGHVWADGWQTDLSTAEAEALYLTAGHQTPGA